MIIRCADVQLPRLLLRPSQAICAQCSIHLSTYHRFISTRGRSKRAENRRFSTKVLHDEWSSSEKNTRDLDKVLSANTDVEEVAILGGGITGLASAYYLAQEFPLTKITIYESKPILGGWLRSKSVDVGNGQVTFESGPRSLRPQAPNGLLALKMAKDLDLLNDLLITPRSSPAAQARFVYYPDHLVRMPGPGQTWWQLAWNLLTEPIFKNLFRGFLWESREPRRPKTLKDESVGSFVSRRLGTESIANNLVSAVFHGIYAGNIWRLSARSILPAQWAAETRHESLTAGALQRMFKRTSWAFCDDIDLQFRLPADLELFSESPLAKCSVFTFKRGIQQLSDRLEQRLAAMENVVIRKSTAIQSLKFDGRNMTLYSKSTAAKSPASEMVKTFSHVISTMPSNTLHTLLTKDSPNPPTSGLSELKNTPSVTVCVVNLYFRTPNLLQTLPLPNSNIATPLEGFGYLIPRSVPYEQNPEHALGVIFDSDISPDLQTTVKTKELGTRLTVMLGGHWWDGYKSTDLPSDAEAIEMARAVLERHLGVTEKPAASAASLQRDCIPQYTVGHSERMSAVHEDLLRTYGGRLRVAGSWYTGVGVNDCLRSGWDVVQGLNAFNAKERTGLERFAWGRPMCLVERVSHSEIMIFEADADAFKHGFLQNLPGARTMGDQK